ncbi:protein kinase [Nocardia uniformis]|uniref:non-specific serine/threonine protein kinase n=1 Tax=Nocardia uniformis TaxID=53432 RepID=A0A849CBQ8_9NOCA|nr:serine/threonine-protein kinase [Nocardia uniformis]NNH75148.1 protein kinase [Nocardia uniformis]
MRLASGEVVAGYIVDRLLGVGGMGAVYLARDPSTDREVALKVLDGVSVADAKTRRNFEREAALATSLRHPNIVPVYDHAVPGDPQLWIAMKYIAGSDISALVRRQGPLRLAQVAQLIGDIAAGLDYAHGAGVLHRDVKPANMLVEVGPDGRERALVTDFGIARTADHTVTLSGMMASFSYTAPERFLGGVADHRADVYSLGCSLCEMLTGRTPFIHSDQAAIIGAHLTATPPRVTDMSPDLPCAVDEILARALAKNPDDRFASCGELAAKVSAAARAQFDRTMPAPRLVRSRAISRRRLLIGASALVPLAAAGVAVPVLRREEPSTPTAAKPGWPVTLRATLTSQNNTYQCFFNREGTLIAGDDRIWDVVTTSVVHRYQHSVLAIRPDGAVLALRQSGAPLARVGDGLPIGQSLTGADDFVAVAAFSPDGALLATATSAVATANIVRLWDASTGYPVGQLTGHTSQVGAIAFSPDNTLLATAGADQTVRLWDTATRQPLGQPLAHSVDPATVAFSPDGTTLVSGGGRLQFWRIQGQSPNITVTRTTGYADSSEGSYKAVAFSPDGAVLAAAGTTIRLWDTRIGQPMGLPIYGYSANAVALNSTGVLAIGGSTVTLWDLRRSG